MVCDCNLDEHVPEKSVIDLSPRILNPEPALPAPQSVRWQDRRSTGYRECRSSIIGIIPILQIIGIGGMRRGSQGPAPLYRALALRQSACTNSPALVLYSRSSLNRGTLAA